MSEKIKHLNRLLKSNIFRFSVVAIAIFSTIFFPLVFIYPYCDSDAQQILIITVICTFIAESITYVIITHFFVYSKFKIAANRLISMSRENDLSKIQEISIDNTATDLLSAVNVTADEYSHLAQVKKTFVANASHELRTPLTSIQGFIQAVLDGTASQEETEKYLKIALSETKRLNSLISSMLDLSRLDSGKNPLTYTKFCINDAIREIAVKFELSLENKSLQINLESERETCYVYADKDKIIQVLTNLIDNAIKYSPAYSRIIVSTGIKENKVYVTIRDFGYGISKKDQMLIWDTFFMSDRSHSPIKAKGSGLGLSIVKKIIDEHGETIRVDSNRGAGATFVFTLTLFDTYKHKISVGKIIKLTDDENTENNNSEVLNGSVL